MLILARNTSTGSLVPRPSQAPVFDCLQYARTVGEGLVNLTSWSMVQASYVVTLICIVMLGRRPILHSVLITKTRQALTENNTKRTKHIQARRNSSKGLPNDMCKISAVTKFSWRGEKAATFGFAMLAAEPAVLLQTRVCSRSRTCLSALWTGLHV